MSPKIVGISLTFFTAVLAFALSVTLPFRDSALQSANNDPARSNVRGTPVIVELFTSEGCSSCPPADQTLSWLRERQPIEGAKVIALSEHVDYWNSLGWTDPYSSAAFSERQQQYAQTLKSEPYTPQMVVDGKVQFVGSDRKQAVAAVSNELKAPRATVELEPINPASSSDGNSVLFSIKVKDLSRLNSTGKAVVLLAVTEDNLKSNVRGGENSGRSLTHAGVVRELKTIGTFDLRPDADFQAQPLVKVASAWKRQDLRAVVFLELQGSHRIIAGAETAFPAL